MHIIIYYSSITGNTKKLALHLRKILRNQGHDTELVNSMRMNIARSRELKEADLYIIAFWCRRSVMDDCSMKILSACTGRRILAVGTMGGNVTGSYGKRVEDKVRKAVEEENECLGVGLCQGAIDLKRIKRRMALPEDDPHRVTEEKYQKSLLTQGHPDEDDLERIGNYVIEVIDKRILF